MMSYRHENDFAKYFKTPVFSLFSGENILPPLALSCLGKVYSGKDVRNGNVCRIVVLIRLV